MFAPIQRLYTWVRRPRAVAPNAFELPESIRLEGLGEVWTVLVRPRGAGSTRVRETETAEGATLQLSTARPNSPETKAALIRWLKRRAKKRLEPRLRDLSDELDLRYSRLRIGLQRTRWGSCSSRGTVSLNAALLFLPEELIDYVLIHELCHLKHLDHSPAFWRLLARHCPESARKARETRLARRRVPAWAIPSRSRRRRP